MLDDSVLHTASELFVVQPTSLLLISIQRLVKSAKYLGSGLKLKFL